MVDVGDADRPVPLNPKGDNLIHPQGFNDAGADVRHLGVGNVSITNKAAWCVECGEATFLD